MLAGHDTPHSIQCGGVWGDGPFLAELLRGAPRAGLYRAGAQSLERDGIGEVSLVASAMLGLTIILAGRPFGWQPSRLQSQYVLDGEG
jgi:hypothetical protein